MTEKERSQMSDKTGTRYGPITRFEIESGSDLESNDMGSMKNFPRAFIPMKELEESPAQG